MKQDLCRNSDKPVSLFLLLVVVCLGCSGQNRKQTEHRIVDFNFGSYYHEGRSYSLKDSVINYLRYLEAGENSKADSLFPAYPELDVSAEMLKAEGGEPYLAGVGNYATKFMQESDRLLSLAVYLNKRHNLDDNVYDKLLRESVRLDTTNVPAIFYLAKLRHEHRLYDDALYLLKKASTYIKGDLLDLADTYERQYPIRSRLNPDLSEFVTYEVGYYEK